MNSLRGGANPLLVVGRRLPPDVVPGEADVAPAERSDVGEEMFRSWVAGGAQVVDSPPNILTVPVHDRGRHQIQAGGPKLQAFDEAIPPPRPFCRLMVFVGCSRLALFSEQMSRCPQNGPRSDVALTAASIAPAHVSRFSSGAAACVEHGRHFARVHPPSDQSLTDRLKCADHAPIHFQRRVVRV